MTGKKSEKKIKKILKTGESVQDENAKIKAKERLEWIADRSRVHNDKLGETKSQLASLDCNHSCLWPNLRTVCDGVQVHRTPSEDWSTCGRRVLSTSLAGQGSLLCDLDECKAVQRTVWARGDPSLEEKVQKVGVAFRCTTQLSLEGGTRKRESEKLTHSLSLSLWSAYFCSFNSRQNWVARAQKMCFFTAKVRLQ